MNTHTTTTTTTTKLCFCEEACLFELWHDESSLAYSLQKTNVEGFFN